MNNNPDNINKFLNIFRSPLKILGLLSIILIFVGIVAAWPFTTPPSWDFFSNGTMQSGETRINGTDVITGEVHANRTTSSYYNTSDGRELQNGGCDASYCIRYNLTDGTTFEAVNGTTGKIEYSGTNIGSILNSTAASSGSNIKVYLTSNVSTNTIIYIKNNTNIEAFGSGWILKSGNNPVFYSNVAVNNVDISGFKIDVQNKSSTVFSFKYGENTDIKIHHNQIVNSSTRPISVANNTFQYFSQRIKIYDNIATDVISGIGCTCYNSQIERNYLTQGSKYSSDPDEYGEGIDSNNASMNVLISDNYIEGFDEDGIDTIGNYGDIIINNRIIGNKTETRDSFGIEIGSNSIVYGNNITGAPNAIKIVGWNNTISDNQLSDGVSTYHFIIHANQLIGTPSYMIISGNRIGIDGSGTYGIDNRNMSNWTITNNIIGSPGSIWNDAGTNYTKITGNTLIGTLQMAGMRNSIISGNHILGSVVSSPASSTQYINNLGVSPFDFGVRTIAPTPVDFSVGFGDSYSNSTSGEPFCKHNGVQFINATGDTDVC